MPGYSLLSNNSFFLAGTAFAHNADLLTVPLATAVGTPSETDPIVVQGYNAFMLLWTTSAGGTYTLAVEHCDPDSQVAQASRQIIAGQATGSAVLFTFGAASTVGPNDVWNTIRFLVTAAGATVTTTDVRMWLGVR